MKQYMRFRDSEIGLRHHSRVGIKTSKVFCNFNSCEVPTDLKQLFMKSDSFFNVNIFSIYAISNTRRKSLSCSSFQKGE